ncbi:BnaAnng04920D [Brassica napus]|uniref:(rape) hypothetical protein n=1 Tax=Brassica napus TaxID=3708 RepID=A0A078HJI1_BRANA|nr:unnamed protein product [Brassica napus]CDY37831.1 BnaAnng04920D [Brassica napus]
MESYSGAMSEEHKNSTLDKSFEHFNQQHSSKAGADLQESSKISEEEFTPTDADFNLV